MSICRPDHDHLVAVILLLAKSRPFIIDRRAPRQSPDGGDMTQAPSQRAHQAAEVARHRPLVIAASALIRADPLVEMVAAFAKLYPQLLVDVLGWLFQGRTHAEERLAERLPDHLAVLPLNQVLVDFARKEATAGRPVFVIFSDTIACAGDLRNRLSFVTDVISFPPQARSGRAKGKALAQQFPAGFEYAGSSIDALDIWREASAAILVDVPRHVDHGIAALVPVSARINGPSRFQALTESLRLHQWVKNLLVFAPIILHGELGNIWALVATMLAFIALGLVTSSTYLLNDILDVTDDRRHWSKRERPIARGDLPASAAAAWAMGGLAAGMMLGVAVFAQVALVLLLYLGLTLAYSLALKRLPLVDGFVLATQFTLRLALGVVAAQVPPSAWLFVFSMFLFTSLSLAKRHTELGRLSRVNAATIAGRGYRADDAPLVLSVGIAAGLGAVIIIILYIIEDAFRQSFYGSTLWLWGFPPTIFLLICRIWLVTVRGEMNDDPVRFMLVDHTSQCLFVVLMTCFLFAWLT